MPELPEVETTKCGIAAHIQNRKISRVIVREHRLRWPIAKDLATQLAGKKFHTITRRGKYILLQTQTGCLIAHLGMSGSIRILPSESPIKKHDHVDIIFAQGQCLRFHDPRRFGCLLWTASDPQQHDLLKHLGPEPLEKEFTGEYLFTKSRKKKIAVKNFIMDSHIVVGVGNIYANEALFLAGIRPQKAAGKISLQDYQRLAEKIKLVLRRAIKMGGTTLRDFVSSTGEPGYFKQVLNVYGRENLPCRKCDKTLKGKLLNQRSTVYCPQCQK